jgi:hypothetical protein
LLALVILQTIVVGLLTVLVVGLLRSHGDVLRRLHELGAGLPDGDGAFGAPGAVGDGDLAGTGNGRGPNGGLDAEAADIAARLVEGVAPPKSEATVARDLAGVTPRGGAVSVGLTGRGRLTMLAFLSSGCSTCAGFWQALRDGQRLVVSGRDVRVVVVTGAAEHEHPSAIAALAPPEATVVMSGPAWVDYGVPATPYFVLVEGERGVIGEGSAAGWPQLAGLVERAVSDRGFALTGDDGGGAIDLTDGDPMRRGGSGREDRADAALLRAGIGPGDERLYQPPIEEPRP